VALALIIREDDLTGAPTLELLRLHLQGMHASSPAGSVYALDLGRLKSPSICVFSAWAGSRVAGIGALKELDADRGEVKSMRTHPDFLRQGVAAAILERIIAEGRQRGMRRLSLETGTGPAFEPALALYRRLGFIDGEAFGDYQRSEFSQFLHLDLQRVTG
jgi:putative acetyltransferase